MMTNNKFNPGTNDFNQQPQDNDNRRTLYLIIGSVVALLVILFIGYRIFFNAKDQTSKNTSSNSDSHISHIKKSGKDTQDEDADTALNGNSGSKGSNNAGVGLDFNKNLSDDDNGMKLTGVTYGKTITTDKEGNTNSHLNIIPRQSNLVTVSTSTSSSFSLYGQPANQNWGKLVYWGELYGFAAYRDGSTWKRIDSIKPIPSKDNDMKDYGGKTSDLISSDISNAASRLATLPKTGSIDNLDLSKWPELANMDKGKDTRKANDIMNKAIIEQANKISVTSLFYMQDQFKTAVTKEGYLSVDKDQRYKVGSDYYVMPSKKAILALISAAQPHSEELVDTWTQTVHHSVYVNSKLIIIDGVAYNLKDVALDLYTTEDASGTIEMFKNSNVTTSQYKNKISIMNNTSSNINA